MSKNSRSVIVQVFDTENVLREACKEGELDISDDEQRKVCFFLAGLIEKLWKKFEIQDVDIQFLLARETDIYIKMSESHLEEFHKNDKHILEHFNEFKLKVQVMKSHISLRQNTRYKWKMLRYLEKEYTDEEMQAWDRPVQDYYGDDAPPLSNDDMEILESWRDTGAPERRDYIGTYFLSLDIDEVYLAKYNGIGE